MKCQLWYGYNQKCNWHTAVEKYKDDNCLEYHPEVAGQGAGRQVTTCDKEG